MNYKIIKIIKKLILYIIIINFGFLNNLLAQNCTNNLSPISTFSVQNNLNISKTYVADHTIVAGQTYVFSFEAKFSANRDNITKIVGVNFEKNNQYFEEFSKVVLSRDFRTYEIEFSPKAGFDKVNVFAFKQDSDVSINVRNACLQLKTNVNENPTNNDCLNNKNSLKIENNITWAGDFLTVGQAIKTNHQYVLTFSAKYIAANEPHIKIAGINFKVGGASIDYREHITSRDLKPYEIVFTAPSSFNSVNTFVWMSEPNGQTKIEVKDICLREIARSSNSQNFNIITLNNYPTPNPANDCGMYLGIASPVNSDYIKPRTGFNNAFRNCFNIIVPENGMKMGTLKTGFKKDGVIPVRPDIWNTEPLNQEIGWANNNLPIRGHTLCWHGGKVDDSSSDRDSKNPAYLNDITNNTDLENVLKNHIRDVINLMNNDFKDNRGKPRVESWDVVNEAFRGIDPDSKFGPFRTFGTEPKDVFVDQGTGKTINLNEVGDANGIECIWERLGNNSNYTFVFNGRTRQIPQYIITAFNEAERVVNLRQDTRNQALIYNDWGAEFEDVYGDKAEAQFQMIKALKNHRTNPVRIDGIGFQCHFNMNPGNPGQITYDRILSFKRNIERYTTEWPDIKIYFTEVDITLPDHADYSDEVSQAMYYKLLAQLAASIPQTEAFITWGLIDKLSWVNSDQTRAPLLFKKEGDFYNPKQTYFKVLEALREANCSSSNRLGTAATELQAQLFEVYPNPFNQYLSINTTNKKGDLKVYDMTGGLRIEQKLNEGFVNINTTHLQPGCYLIELSSNGIISRQKIVKH